MRHLTQNWHVNILGLVLFLFTAVLLLIADNLSISYKEALTFYDETNLLHYLSNFSVYFLGQNNIALRFPFILFYVLSVILMYKMTADYFKYESDRLISVLIFMFLPGIIGASLLVNNSIIVIFCTILYLYYYRTYNRHNYVLLFIFVFLDNSFAILFLALFFYAMKNRQNKLFIISLMLFGLSMYIFGFDTFGKPKSHILDTFAIYASIFSPLLFLYFFYSMYRIGVKGKRSIYWYVSMTAFLFSFLLSFRQKIYIEDFAPFVVVTVPLMMKLFFHSLRVRLPRFRDKHYKVAALTLFLLFVNVGVILFNKPIYLMLKQSDDHFAYNYHFADEIAQLLQKRDIHTVTSNDYKLLKRLEFYGIHTDKKSTNFISIKPLNVYDKKFQIDYLNTNILNIYYLNLKK